MASLIAAHRGYEYQDLLVACRLVDVLLGSVVQVHVDEKLTENDTFDDLSTIDVDGRRERTQFKHTENADRPLSLATFTTEARDLRLDRVIASILADRGGPGQHAKSFSYRILLRDVAPVDPALTTVLRPFDQDDPGAFVPGIGTRRFRFDAAALWSQRNGSTAGGTDGPFRFLDCAPLTLLDLDGERNERVLSEAVFGSLVGRLAAGDPTLVVQHRPRFAADEEALEGCVRRSVAKDPNRKVALIVDGLDHITRVRARAGDRFDPSKSLAESLAALDLPAGSVVIVLSQPGSHLQPLDEVGARTVTVPGLSRGELELLAARLNVLPGAHQASLVAGPLLEDPDGIAGFLDALEDRTKGNALYATYLCRETLRRADTLVDPAATVRSLPQFDGTLKSYYDHLYQAVGAEAGWVADVIALVNFAVTRGELREIRPDAAHRVDAALTLLAPVLVERATQGGVRVYHESFAMQSAAAVRFLSTR